LIDNPNFQPFLTAKFNFVLFRGFTILNPKLENKYFLNFTKENFKFFNSLTSGNYRIFKLCRCIKVQKYLFLQILKWNKLLKIFII